MSYGNKGAEGHSVGPDFVEVYVYNQVRGNDTDGLYLKLLNTDYPFVVGSDFSCFLIVGVCVCVCV